MGKSNLNDYQAVIAVVNQYLEGCATGNAQLLEQAFHENGVMAGHIDGELRMNPPARFINRVRETGAPEPSFAGHVDVIALEGTIAVAHVVMENWNGMDFVDYHTLLKIDGVWKIVAKGYHQFA